MEIKYFNRYSNAIEVEKVYGDGAVKWMYDSTSGKALAHFLVKAPFSKFYGIFQDMSFSKGKIPEFVKNFNIPMDDFIPEDGFNLDDPYPSFNSFFIRRFKAGKRPFVNNPSEMGAFSEARYYGYESVKSDETVPVKGNFLTPEGLVASDKWESTFKEGPLLLARLCPVDYHRYHYPDKGEVLDSYRVHGAYHSVNPLALKMKQDILISNERQVTILETENFGKLAYIEVGAICVGKIVQSGPLDKFNKGDEKGYFLFGGSTVIVVGEKGKWKPSDDILKNTKEGRETYIHLGDSVATTQ